MKVTVCINETKIVVPCGDGDLSVRQLAELAIIRYRKTALSKGTFPNFIEINSLKLARDGGILDWDDKVHDVLDDRDLLIAQHSSNDQMTGNCPSGTLSSPPLPHHNSITPGDIITSDVSTTSSTNQLPVSNQTSQLPLVSTKYVPLSFGSSLNPELYTSRHNSIPCSDQDIHRHFDLLDSATNARHESLDDILDFNNPNRKLHNYNSLNTEYEKWPLPPFPTISTLQSSTETTVLPNNMTLQLHDTDGDDLTWDNSPNDCDEEDYPRLRPDYIVKHFKTNQGKSMENSVPSRQVLQWLESQECGSVSSSGGGGGGVGTSSYEAGSDIKESESTHIAANILDDRNNNRVHVSYSSVSSGNDHNRLREDGLSIEQLSQQQQIDNSIIVRLTNIKAGENLGIQIVPAYIQSSSMDRTFDNEQKCIYGIEVHSIVPKGRVAKERQLNKGDKIIQINDINLTGMLYERGESIFRDALQKPECKLRVIPVQYPVTLPCSTSMNKSNPPPPPRRSPNTALSGTKSNSGSSDKCIPILSQEATCKSPVSNASLNVKTGSSKLNPAPPPPSQQKPVASWTSGFGSMVHTPASSTSSVSAVDKRKFDQASNNVQSSKSELIELTKIGSGFGFSITGADNLPPNIPSAVYVRHILPDGAAIRDGRLKSDDRLLEVDGLLLDGMSQSEVIALLREKPSGSRVKLLVERNTIKKNSPCSASHDSLMTSLSEMEEDGSTLSKSKRNSIKLQFDIPLNDSSSPGGRTTLGISVKVEPNWDKANITPFSSKEDIAASNIVWVKTVIENGAAYRHGKLMVGDQLLEVNGHSLSGLCSEEALSKLKNIIREAQESVEGLIRIVVMRKINMARSSSLNTLNSVTGSGSAISYKPVYDHNRNLSHKLANYKNIKNIPSQFSQSDSKDADIVPNKLMVDLPNTNPVKPSTKQSKRSAPLPPTPDPRHTDSISAEKSTKPKPVPPPPPLARRLKNIQLSSESHQFDAPSNQSTSEVPANVDHHYSSYLVNKISESNNTSDEFPAKHHSEPLCNSTTNTLCRHKENSQLILRARNTRSNCSYTPTNAVIHLDDIDWDKMELIPFDNCTLTAAAINNTVHTTSTGHPAINEDIQSKKIDDTGVHKRKVLKKFSLGQMFRFKHPHDSKPSNSAGSSPVNIRKEPTNLFAENSVSKGIAIPTSSSSYSLKLSDQADETEFPYAELDFSNSPATSKPELMPMPLIITNNMKSINHMKKSLLPLPEESFKFLQSPSSEESDSYDDFVDMQTTFPGHQISAVQRIAAATPKQPPNRFVYEDAEELFQTLQANVSPCHDINLTSNTFGLLSNFTQSHNFHQTNHPDSKDFYQNITTDLSPNNIRPLKPPAIVCRQISSNKHQ